MKKIDTIVNDLSTNEQSLYYYQQGFEIGQEEAIYNLINKMALANISIDEISKITELPLENIKCILD